MSIGKGEYYVCRTIVRLSNNIINNNYVDIIGYGLIVLDAAKK